jgi:ribulose-5-phosphate 4-epimerase/fuculose-1-phosphate aldolase
MSEEEEELKKEIIECVIFLHQRGLMTGQGGNISARLPGTEEIWITPSGVYKPKLKPDDLVKLDLEGNVLEGILKPSSEMYFHTAIYKKRTDINAVIHTHSPVSTGLALAGVRIKPITLEAAVMLTRVPILPFIFPGTKELGEKVGESIMGNRVLLLQNHGPIAVGYDLIEAMSIIETLEECAMMMFVASHFGQPAEIPPEEIEYIKKRFGL